MIEFRDVTKKFIINGQTKTVIQGLNLHIPTRRSLGLLGRNGAGKSTLLKMIAGSSDPTSGSIHAEGLGSWPVGFAGSFHPDLTGLQNCRFVARIYGVETDGLVEFVEDFADLGQHFRLPIRSYSSGMRSRLAFAVSMGIQFDIYLVDEITAVGDAAFRQNADLLFKQRTKDSGAVVCSHSMVQIKNLCDCGLVLNEGEAWYYDNVDDAILHHQDNMARLTR